MRLGLLTLFIAAPLIELALLIELGRQIGFWWTILIVVATAIIGTAVLQQQGLETIGRINRSMAEGIPPLEPVAEGFILLLAGAFLLTPGIITDGIGFFLLIPQFRRGIARWAFAKLLTDGYFHIETSSTSSDTSGPGSRENPQYSRQPHTGSPHKGHSGSDNSMPGGPIIDGEFERIDEPRAPQAPHQNVKPRN
ncbi:MAG: FxsA family protein [Hyphomicrobiaceae bacterium]